ncbi:hypothetical protein BGZ63DRAFT_392350 [Mariannaea sp. PMI_226]|nr:hypothetical protein BGZ63DRAFT_392350 [Mariannaea sp. PMI_226]
MLVHIGSVVVAATCGSVGAGFGAVPYLHRLQARRYLEQEVCTTCSLITCVFASLCLAVSVACLYFELTIVSNIIFVLTDLYPVVPCSSGAMDSRKSVCGT